MHKQKLIQAVLVGAAITFSASSWAVPSGGDQDYEQGYIAACMSGSKSTCLEYLLHLCYMNLQGIQEPQQSSQQKGEQAHDVETCSWNPELCLQSLLDSCSKMRWKCSEKPKQCPAILEANAVEVAYIKSVLRA